MGTIFLANFIIEKNILIPMKRIFLFFLSILIINSTVAVAQAKYYKRALPKFNYGIKAGINIANQSSHGNDTITDVKNISRFNIGGFCNYSFSKYFSVQPELIISGKGSHWEDPYDEMVDLPLYIDIPLLIKIQPVNYLSVVAGPQAGLRIRAMQKEVETGVKTNINGYYNFLDLGLVCGLEATLPNRVNLTVRYIIGLSSATTDQQYIDSWYNNVLQLSAGYILSGRPNKYNKNRYRR